MPRVCTVCVHKSRLAIDQALVMREPFQAIADPIDQALFKRLPFRIIADRFGVSKTALIRHHDNHLPAVREEIERSLIKQMFEEGVAAGYFEKCRSPDGTEAYRLTEKSKKGAVNWHVAAGNA